IMISVVQTTSKQQGLNVTTLSFNLTSVLAGSTIFVALFAWHSGGTDQSISVSDGDGKYSRDCFYQNAIEGVVGIFRLQNASAGTHAIVINCVSSSNYINACAIEVSTGNHVLALDNSNFARGNSTTPSSGAINVSLNANEFIITSMVIPVNQASITVEVTSPIWTQVIEDLDFSTSIAGEIDRKIVSSAGSYTANWTLA